MVVLFRAKSLGVGERSLSRSDGDVTDVGVELSSLSLYDEGTVNVVLVVAWSLRVARSRGFEGVPDSVPEADIIVHVASDYVRGRLA